jgi:hypothetical protein
LDFGGKSRDEFGYRRAGDHTRINCADNGIEKKVKVKIFERETEFDREKLFVISRGNV